MEPVPINDLPEDLRSRVRAATGEPEYRMVYELPAESGGSTEYLVEAITGDRVTVMRLSLRPDGAVNETTDSFPAREIVHVANEAQEAELIVQTQEGRRSLAVQPDTAAAVAQLLHAG